MKTWLKELERELRLRFYVNEVSDIISFYEEMIEDRLASGEDIDDILSDYDAKEIAKSMTTDVVMKRANDTYQAVAKSSKQLLKFLLSTPLLLPIGFAYVIILIVFGSIIFSLGVAILASTFAIAVVLINMFQAGLGQNEIIAFTGAALIGFSFMTFILIWISKATLYISKELIELFSKLAKKKEKNNESI
ncbi:DUF1700 domain-containing protein [Mariniplasma anaerobium]|uniref:DUF1700 domain-containing protein n=1 Tax=Mariniplasma anaerobium TaxID=2735436 RepID=A0A7U9TJR3_9MOLU|nr:DUF1700 domain-containing protein [Mariniplasma anaerobium]BCR36641.1 hypothetical protein MPAN_015340 [Mariniplasma anaerobium]